MNSIIIIIIIKLIIDHKLQNVEYELQDLILNTITVY